MKKFGYLLMLCVLCTVLTACGEPTVTLGGDTPSEPTTPTVAVPAGQMTVSALMGRMGTTMTWSSIASYTHTEVDATHATFRVADTYGKECTLTVTYDEATDTVTEATLSYGETTVNVMTDDTLVMRTIMLAMNEE